MDFGLQETKLVFRRTARILAVVVPAALVLLFPAGRADGATLNEFATSGTPQEVVAGPGGNVWFTETSPDEVGYVTPGGSVTEFPVTSGSTPKGIAVGPDGNVWFSEPGHDAIGRVTPTGTVTEFTTGISAGSHPDHIVAGPDGSLWFTEPGTNGVAKITTAGSVTEFTAGITAASAPTGIAVGSDGALWFTEKAANQIGRITTAGAVSEFSLAPGAAPVGITAASDGALWFAESGAHKIGRITTAGSITQFSLPFNSEPPQEIGADGADLVFSEQSSNPGVIGRMTSVGIEADRSFAQTTRPLGVTTLPDGSIWFAETSLRSIGSLQPQTAPVATTGVAGDLTQTSATLGGSLVPGDSNTAYAFEWGTSPSLGNTTPTHPVGSGTANVDVTQPLGGLAAGETIYYRLVAASIDGTSDGTVQRLTTPTGVVAPTISSEAATSIRSTTALLTGSVVPNNGTTTYRFEYGPTPSYGTTTPDTMLPADAATHTVVAAVSGLPSGTTIHFQVVATNSSGTANGPDQTFATYTSVAPGAAGAFDTSFGSGGTAAFSFGSSGVNSFSALARQSDGKVVFVGTSSQLGGTQIVVERLNVDGSPDSSFGDNGTVLLDLGDGNDVGTAVAIQPDGKILVGGDNASGDHVDLVRLTPTGTFDFSFGNAGVVQSQLGNQVSGARHLAGIAVDPAEPGIVLGASSGGALILANFGPDGTPGALVGLSASGPGSATATAFGITPSGQFLLAGSANGHVVVRRFTSDTLVDTTWGMGDGLITLNEAPASSADQIGIEPDGTVVIPISGGTEFVDPYASSGGRVVAISAPGASSTTVDAVATDGSGILASGEAMINGNPHGFVVRLNPGGSPDGSFGQDGYLTFPGFTSFAGIAISGDDAYVAGANVPDPDAPTFSATGASVAALHDPAAMPAPPAAQPPSVAQPPSGTQQPLPTTSSSPTSTPVTTPATPAAPEPDLAVAGIIPDKSTVRLTGDTLRFEVAVATVDAPVEGVKLQVEVAPIVKDGRGTPHSFAVDIHADVKCARPGADANVYCDLGTLAADSVRRVGFSVAIPSWSGLPPGPVLASSLMLIGARVSGAGVAEDADDARMDESVRFTFPPTLACSSGSCDAGPTTTKLACSSGALCHPSTGTTTETCTGGSVCDAGSGVATATCEHSTCFASPRTRLECTNSACLVGTQIVECGGTCSITGNRIACDHGACKIDAVDGVPEQVACPSGRGAATTDPSDSVRGCATTPPASPPADAVTLALPIAIALERTAAEHAGDVLLRNQSLGDSERPLQAAISGLRELGAPSSLLKLLAGCLVTDKNIVARSPKTGAVLDDLRYNLLYKRMVLARVEELGRAKSH